jgi:transcriptional regulator with XRE-family HTH domain
MTFLELLRIQRGLSKAEAARLVHMLLTDYTLVERGLREPGENAAMRLKARFGYEPDLLTADVLAIVTDALGKPNAHATR